MFPVLFPTIGARAGGSAGCTWAEVAAPDAAFSWLPFAVEQCGSSFRVEESWDIRTHANITVTHEYFVDTVNGLDTNAGTRVAPFKTWNKAAGMADVDRIVLLDGSYCTRTKSTTEPARSVEVIGEGTVYITSDHKDICTDWVSEGSDTYSTILTSSNFVQRVVDEGVVDANGNPTRYTTAASVAACKAAAGSFYWTGGTLYVHAIDGRALTGNPSAGNLWLLDSLARALQADSKSYYFYNVNFRGTMRARNSTATGGLKVYLDACIFTACIVTLAGVSECVIEDCTILDSFDDGINIDIRNGIASQVAVVGTYAGEGGTLTDHQGSDGHNNCTMVHVNCTYEKVSGQAVADAGGSGNGYTWMLGCVMRESATDVAYFTDDYNVWLHGCTLDGDLTESGAGAIHLRDCTVTGTQTGNISAY
jgi:hypothetical protein